MVSHERVATLITMHYQLFHNQTASFCRPYEPGDVLVAGWKEDFPSCFKPRTDVDFNDLMLRLAETIFAKHNRDDRPDGKLAPSLSVGDVVVIGEVALSVASIGFEFVNLVDDEARHDLIKRGEA